MICCHDFSKSIAAANHVSNQKRFARVELFG
jgi:hypothetical protein